MRKYTWRKDSLDPRDLKYSVVKSTLPAHVDLSPAYSLVFDQGQLGSCTGNSIAMGFDFTLVKEGKKPIVPSRLFIYYNERSMEGTIASDAGAEIRDGIKSLNQLGVCPESEWPYTVSKFKTKPVVKCYTDAKKNLLSKYMTVDNSKLDNLRSCLADGYGFVFGFTVYPEFESDAVAKTGIVPLPKKNEKPLGGHAVFCVGYDDVKKQFKVRNSWGIGWGDKGHFYMPYDYITDTQLCDDFWTMRTI